MIPLNDLQTFAAALEERDLLRRYGEAEQRVAAASRPRSSTDLGWAHRYATARAAAEALALEVSTLASFANASRP